MPRKQWLLCGVGNDPALARKGGDDTKRSSPALIVSTRHDCIPNPNPYTLLNSVHNTLAINNATIFTILIIGFIAGPAVSL